MTSVTPRFVTKFVSDEYFAATRCGRLKLGTLSEYRSLEGASEARLSDGHEGVWSESITEDLKNFTGSIGANTFINCSFVGGRKGSVLNQTLFDAFVFCVSGGKYSRAIHDAIIDAGNPSLDRFVVFETERLATAIQRAVEYRYPGYGRALSGNIRYVDKKEEELSADEAARRFGQSSHRVSPETKAIFFKSDEFEHEQEFRLALIPGSVAPPLPGPLFVRDLPRRFAEAIEKAVVGSG